MGLDTEVYHKNGSSDNWRCPPCKKSFTSKRALARHLKENKRHRANKRKAESVHKCVKCSKTCARPYDLRRHIREKHPRVPTMVTPYEEETPPGIHIYQQYSSSPEDFVSIPFPLQEDCADYEIPMSPHLMPYGYPDLVGGEHVQIHRSSGISLDPPGPEPEPSYIAPIDAIRCVVGSIDDRLGRTQEASKASEDLDRRAPVRKQHDDTPQNPNGLKPPAFDHDGHLVDKVTETALSSFSLADVPLPNELKVMPCGYCHEAFELDQYRVLEHLRSHQTELNAASVTCDVCKISFVRTADLKYHEDAAKNDGNCGFGFEHRAPCSGHHPNRGRDRDRFHDRLRHWEQSQLRLFRRSVDHLMKWRTFSVPHRRIQSS